MYVLLFVQQTRNLPAWGDTAKVSTPFPTRSEVILCLGSAETRHRASLGPAGGLSTPVTSRPTPRSLSRLQRGT